MGKKRYGDSCPDVVKVLKDGRSPVEDTKRRKEAVVFTVMERVKEQYCECKRDIPHVNLHPHHKHGGYVVIDEKFFLEFLRNARLT